MCRINGLGIGTVFDDRVSQSEKRLKNEPKGQKCKEIFDLRKSRWIMKRKGAQDSIVLIAPGIGLSLRVMIVATWQKYSNNLAYKND
jgi:hypothetical protein